MLSIKVTAIVSFLAFGVAYFYTPVPDGATTRDQWLMRKVYAVNQVGRLIVSRTSQFFTKDNPLSKILLVTGIFEAMKSLSLIEKRNLLEGTVRMLSNI